jgi:hypothetical protein
MIHDFNRLESRATELVRAGRFRDALRIYFFMADGDPSLDAGYLAKKIGECYESLGEPYAAKYWHGRAIEEGAGAWPDSSSARRRLEQIVSIDDLVVTEHD